MKIQANSYAQYRANNLNTVAQNTPSFGTTPPIERTLFDKIGDFCNVNSKTGSLTRTMFFLVGVCFMLGGRFFESRDNDEKREVLTRDVPAVALSAAGAPMLNNAMAYGVTKKTGIPIMTLGKNGGILNANFASQKQVIDWYSNLGKDALLNFSETVSKHGGNIQKAMKKLGFSDKLAAITNATDNNAIINAIKDAQANKTEAFQALEKAMKELTTENPLLKSAKRNQAYVKLAGIGFMAAVLGYFLPHLNILVTRKKYEGKVDEATFEKKMMRTSPVFRVSSGVLSFHNTSAQETFKNLFSIIEQSNSSSN